MGEETPDRAGFELETATSLPVELTKAVTMPFQTVCAVRIHSVTETT